jgi:excinuclease ABC subunit A
MTVAAEADDGGGQIIAQGPPEKIAKSKTSRTAPFLMTALR